MSATTESRLNEWINAWHTELPKEAIVEFLEILENNNPGMTTFAVTNNFDWNSSYTFKVN